MNIDSLLKDFLSEKVRKKVYSACALVSLLATVLAGNEAVQSSLNKWPTATAIFSAVMAVVSLLARANVNEDTEE